VTDAVASALEHGGEPLMLDPLGVLWLPARAVLVVADLHLEKGSAFARRGTLLPPYDTARTLRRLGWAIERYRPQVVVSLGDAFHDRAGALALSADDRRTLAGLARGRSWLWVRGNHDPEPPAGLAGESLDVLDLGRLRFAHLPEAPAGGRALVAGHLHPKARVAQGARKATRPCFVGDDRLLLLPAFGAYTGGLNVLDTAIRGLFGAGFSAFMLGEARVFRVPHRHLRPDPPDWRRHQLAEA
jgi:DNA ligase-associated metallophosphoesterase